MSSRVLILVDGTAVLYRAFYAIPSLATASGRPTNAVFGFIRMLKQIAGTWSPTHWVVVFDGGLPEKRLALQESYKAQRKPMPDLLKARISAAIDYLDRAGIAWIKQERQEADDVMASLAAKAETEAERVLLATSDKDMYQLVSERLRVIPVAGKDAGELAMGVEEVLEKTGVAPSQIVEWLALVGDTSDNIPGVPGIGRKTAARLLRQYGSIEALFAGLRQLDNTKIRMALETSRELILRNIEMVRLVRDLDSEVDWNRFQFRCPRPEKLLPFMEDMEFHSLAGELRQQSLFQ